MKKFLTRLLVSVLALGSFQVFPSPAQASFQTLSVSGTVVDEEAQNLAGGFAVSLYGEAGLFSADVSENGNFSVAVPMGQYSVDVVFDDSSETFPGFSAVRTNLLVMDNIEDLNLSVSKWAVGSGGISGVLRNSYGPIQGRVSINSSQVHFTRTTTNDGTFSFPNLPDGSYSVTLRSLGHYTVNHLLSVSGGSQEIVSQTLQVNSSNTLSGRVLSKAGTQLPDYSNVWIQACAISGWCTHASLNAQGEYEISNVPLGKLNLSVYGGSNSKIFSQQLSATVLDGSNQKDIFVDQYPTGIRVIAGRILSAGSPVAGANVSLYSQDGKRNYQAQTNDLGQFQFSELLSGKYSLSTYRDGYRHVSGSYKSVVLTDEANLTVNLSLALRSSGVLSGRLVDQTESPSGVPGSLSVCLDATGECSYTSSDNQGNFVLRNVPQGSLRVRVTPSDQSIFQVTDSTFVMSTNQSTHDFAVTSVPEGTASIEGRVKSGGVAVANAFVTVQIYAPNQPDAPIQSLSTTSLSDGSYRFDAVVNGRAAINISPSGFGTYQSSYVEFALAANEQKTLNPILYSTSSALDLDVCAMTCNNTENRISAMQIAATAFGPKYEGGPEEPIWSGQTTTDFNGVASFSGLPEVPVGKLRLQSNSYASTGGFFVADANQSEIRNSLDGIGLNQAISDGSNSNQIELAAMTRSGTQSVTFHVLDIWGAEIPNSNFKVDIRRTISALRSTTYLSTETIQSDDSGRFTVGGLSSGDSISVEGIDGYSIYCSAIVRSNQPTRTNVCFQQLDEEVVVENGDGSISGSLVDQYNAPVQSDGQEIQIELCRAGGFHCFASAPVVDGSFSFADLPIGTYSVRALSPSSKYAHGLPQELTISEQENSVAGVSLVLSKFPEGRGNSISATLLDPRLNVAISGAGITLRPLEITGAEFSNEDEHLNHWTDSDFSGSFRFRDLAPGTYSLSFSKYVHSENYEGQLNRLVYAQLEPMLIRVGEGEQVSLPDIEWNSQDTSAPNTLLVELIDRNTRDRLSIPDTQCWVNSANDGIRGDVQDDGKFLFNNLIVGARYQISCSTESSLVTSGRMIEPVIAGQTFIAEAGENKLLLPSSVIEMNGKISGRILDENDNPIPGVEVGAMKGYDDCSDDSFGCGGTAYGDWDTTDSEGYFYLEHVPEIEVDFTVNHRLYSLIYEVVDMSLQQTLERNVVLHPIKNVTGTLEDVNGLPVDRSQSVQLVRASEANQYGSMETTVDDQGEFRFVGVPFGDYVIRLTRSNQTNAVQTSINGFLDPNGNVTSRASEARVITISGQSQESTDLGRSTVPSGSSISGEVRFVDGNGTAVLMRSASLVARIYVKDGEQWRFIRPIDQWLQTQNGKAKYSFGGLVTGQYKVRFSDVPWNGEGLKTLYNGGGSTLEGAPEISLSSNTPQIEVNISMSAQKPTTNPPTLVLNFSNFSDEQIAHSEGAIQATVGESTVRIQAPADLAGQWVTVGYAETSQGAASVTPEIRRANAAQQDWIQLDANGVASISTSTVVGNEVRKLAVISSRNQLVGWTPLAARPRFQLTPTPTIAGTLRIGQTLTAITGTWDSGTTFSYSWKRDGVAILGAQRSSYILSREDVGKTITVGITASKQGIPSLIKTSSASIRVAAAPQRPQSVYISGTAARAKKLSLKTTGWVAYPTATLKYQWYRCVKSVKSGLTKLTKASRCTAISRATKSTYTLGRYDRYRYVVGLVTASNSLGKTTSISKSTSRVR